MSSSKNNLITLKDHDDIENMQFPHMLLIYADWCGHCKAITNHEGDDLLPDKPYDQAANIIEFENDKVYFYRIEKTNFEKLQTELQQKIGNVQVPGFPTILYCREDNNVDYNGERSVDGIVDFLTKQKHTCRQITPNIVNHVNNVNNNNVYIRKS